MTHTVVLGERIRGTAPASEERRPPPAPASGRHPESFTEFRRATCIRRRTAWKPKCEV